MMGRDGSPGQPGTPGSKVNKMKLIRTLCAKLPFVCLSKTFNYTDFKCGFNSMNSHL